jgi:hypothetical protein
MSGAFDSVISSGRCVILEHEALLRAGRPGVAAALREMVCTPGAAGRGAMMSAGRSVVVAVLFCMGVVAAGNPPGAQGKMGLQVGPSKVVFAGVSPGKSVCSSEHNGYRVTVQNQLASQQVLLLSVRKPSEAGFKPGKACEEIPDISWITCVEPEGDVKKPLAEIEVKAGGSRSFDLCVTVPDRKEYRGKQYEAVLRITSKPGEGQSPPLTLYPRVRIETLAAE